MTALVQGAMAVPATIGVNVGLAATLGGGGLLLLTALWWTMAGDGTTVARDRWPWIVRAMAIVGWALWAGGLLLQVVAHVGQVGVASWPGGPGH